MLSDQTDSPTRKPDAHRDQDAPVRGGEGRPDRTKDTDPYRQISGSQWYPTDAGTGSPSSGASADDRKGHQEKTKRPLHNETAGRLTTAIRAPVPGA